MLGDPFCNTPGPKKVPFGGSYSVPLGQIETKVLMHDVKAIKQNSLPLQLFFRT